MWRWTSSAPVFTRLAATAERLERPEFMTAAEMHVAARHRLAESEHFDVLIVGAGLSGIGGAFRLQERCPRRTFAILEARDAIGGTWDLFRYPGVRSDSDMFTLGYAFRPWTGR